MNKEEIHKALEIIRQPITVNCKDYHYFDNENYDKLIRVYENCLWFINNFEQINETVEIVQKRNEKINHNWNELKKWLEDETRQYWNTDILDKMQELERGEE